MMPGIVVARPGPATTTDVRSASLRCARPIGSLRRNTVPPKTLAHDHAEAAEAVAQCVEVAATVDAISLEAGDFVGAKAPTVRTDVDQQLHLEPVGVDADRIEAARPQPLEAVRPVGVPGTEEEPDEKTDAGITDPAQLGDVRGAPAVAEAAPLDVVRAVDEGIAELLDVGAVH